jgi:hypothetical protein
MDQEIRRSMAAHHKLLRARKVGAIDAAIMLLGSKENASRVIGISRTWLYHWLGRPGCEWPESYLAKLSAASGVSVRELKNG